MNNLVYLAIIDDASMRQVIALGVPGTAMPPFATTAGGSLTDKQIGIVIDGIRKSWAGPQLGLGRPPYASTDTGNPNRDAKLYSANCQSCHGPDGKGGPHRRLDYRRRLLVASKLKQYLRSLVIAGRPDLPHPDLEAVSSGQPLSSAQVSRRGRMAPIETPVGSRNSRAEAIRDGSVHRPPPTRRRTMPGR